ncbi:MAG: prolipoprotein diacylglyceryl transferase [Spirochaetaceae bacterium]|nr:prolipoprotein diacylglyceryl transferase [Spirochaetaceae bacterium]
MESYLTAPTFNPVLVDLPGPLAVSWYGMMYFCGFLFAYFFVHRHIKKRKILMTADEFSNILALIFLGVLVGGRLGFTLFVHPSYYLRHPLEILAVWDGGMYFFGGLFAAMFLPWLAIRKTKLNYLDVADLIIIPAPMALAFGRWGNFINGEFWGKPSRAPWAMVFDTVPEADRFDASLSWVAVWADAIGMDIPSSGLVNLPRHPVQLYELILEGIILFAVLLAFRNIGKPKPRGSVLSLFLLCYGLMRFLIEFYRHPSSHSALILGSGWFTISMLFTLPMIAAGAAGLIRSFSRKIPNAVYGDPMAKKRKGKSKSGGAKRR